MSDIENALHELDRLQKIIDRHEGHIFTLRGWLLAVVGGLLAAYYTENIIIPSYFMSIALVFTVCSFLVIEFQHLNLVEAAAKRAGEVEKQIQKNGKNNDWYKGPDVSETCKIGAFRFKPVGGMTWRLNLPFYVTVFILILTVSFSLPPKASIGMG